MFIYCLRSVKLAACPLYSRENKFAHNIYNVDQDNVLIAKNKEVGNLFFQKALTTNQLYLLLMRYYSLGASKTSFPCGVLCISSSCVLCTQCCHFLWIVNFGLPLGFSLTFTTRRSHLCPVLRAIYYLNTSSITSGRPVWSGYHPQHIHYVLYKYQNDCLWELKL